MSQSTRAKAAPGRRGFRRRKLPSTSGPGRSGFEEEARLLPSQFRLLIDENLSPTLVRVARRQGFYSVHVNEINLRTAGDKHIARYAVDNGMILVTNNIADFTRLYRRRSLHPGLIFLQCNVKGAFTEASQATMLRAALDDLLENDLVQEAIRVALVKGTDEALLLKLTKHVLPD